MTGSPAAAAPQPQGLIAGFDAGQSHTRCRLALPHPAAGVVLAEGEGPGVCHLAAPDGPERFRAALQLSLQSALERLPAEAQAQAGPEPLLAAAIGASGIEQGTAVQEEGRRLAARALQLPLERLEVTGDERTALHGAFAGGAGILVISGTGTIAVGQDGQGRSHRCGGWGWLLDGAGSAMDIGRDGLALSLRMADGRSPDSDLRRALWQALDLGVDDPQAPQRIKTLVVQPQFGAAGFAALAPVVNDLARRGDAEAAAILEANAAALAAMVVAVAAALELQNPAVVTSGGALRHLEGLHQRFAQRLQEGLGGAHLVDPQGDACAGALQLAQQLADQAA
ncbi:BadF/BadG/BcrA/BcrD ATPase family protein [Synechococcus sp. CS-1328]|uniref:BadF/BadG/BcrA/BcrD ATPase family protein n=1 Tax=Synechococcus sp. CS-1328 TaxID=2847976 RepID=UPI00223A9712|nr:BadF/BadG/BcrA/BcrD ATPase family protein [Synechococcus sp. CS-1328]MCT0224538.1 N-acetylglucosamine kinase [Synechococcus sp. CS-1328]